MNNKLVATIFDLIDTLVAYESNDSNYINKSIVVTCSVDMNRRIMRIHFNMGDTILDGGLDYIEIDLGYFNYKVSAMIDNEVSNAWQLSENYTESEVVAAVTTAFHGMAAYCKNWK